MSYVGQHAPASRQHLASGRSYHHQCCLTYVHKLTNFDDRADATIAQQSTGAMSWAFITALKKRPQQSYVQLLNSIRDELEPRYSQKPQLSCSHPLSRLTTGILC